MLEVKLRRLIPFLFFTVGTKIPAPLNSDRKTNSTQDTPMKSIISCLLRIICSVKTWATIGRQKIKIIAQ